MDAKSYCDTVRREVTGWKANLYDVLRKAEKLPVKQKSKAAPMIAQLNAVIDDLDAKLAILERECPAEYSSHRTAIQDKLSQGKTAWKEVWGVMGEPEYGIGGP
jgi:hypothetical protein